LSNFVSLEHLDLDKTYKDKQALFVCNSSNSFLQYFSFLVIQKRLKALFKSVGVKVFNVGLDNIREIPSTSLTLFKNKFDALVSAFFGCDNIPAKSAGQLLEYITGYLSSTGGYRIKVLYLDNFNGAQMFARSLIESEICKVVNLENLSWRELEKIIDVIFAYFAISPSETTKKKAYAAFLPTNFYELFSILKLIDMLQVDKSDSNAIERCFNELLKKTSSRKSLKSLLKKDIKTYGYYKDSIKISRNEDWKALVKYQILEVLEQSLSTDLLIDEKIDWWLKENIEITLRKCTKS
jgi:hypothetical protein